MVEAADNIFFDISNANFTINQTPPSPPLASFSIGGGSEICAGGLLNFTDQSTNNPSQWQWTFEGGSPTTSTLQNPTNVQFSAPGTYTVALTVSNSGGSNTTSQTVTVNPLPTADISVNPSFAGQSTGSATLTPGGGEAPYTISWAVNPPQSGPTATNLAPGDYVVTVTDNNGCFSAFNFTILGNANVENMDAFSISLFPNPADDLVNISVSFGSYRYELTDAAGRTVRFGEFTGTLYSLSLDELSAGIYTLRINNKEGQMVRKLLKAGR
jgi:PKD repeat protein